MATIFPKKIMNGAVFFLSVALSSHLFAAQTEFSSTFVNQSNLNHAKGFRLVKTRMWPSPDCLLDAGKQVVNPGESTSLKIKNDPRCNESGIGYSIFRAEDTKNEHLLGYVSHRFANGKFSLQISRFCESSQCVFFDLNPEQQR